LRTSKSARGISRGTSPSAAPNSKSARPSKAKAASSFDLVAWAISQPADSHGTCRTCKHPELRAAVEGIAAAKADGRASIGWPKVVEKLRAQYGIDYSVGSVKYHLGHAMKRGGESGEGEG
jgi:hypothetical protein